MPEPPRRKRFQIHLSTAIVLLFVAGALNWVNVREQRVYSNLHYPKGDPQDELLLADEMRFGWPCVAAHKNLWLSLDRIRGLVSAELEWHTGGIIANVLVALAILFATWFVCEWLIRRHAARKGA